MATLAMSHQDILVGIVIEHSVFLQKLAVNNTNYRNQEVQHFFHLDRPLGMPDQ